ncbi:MAG: ATP-binding cassette domain-containing protein [Bacilli bacterium]
MRITLCNVSKSFKDHLLFENIDYSFESGHIYGIIGCNGSGKTVLLKMMLGLSNIKDGKIIVDGKVMGKDIKVIPSVGAIVNKPIFFNELTSFENLKLLANINNKITDQDIYNALELVGLSTDSKQKIKTYSLGMNQRLGIAQAIMENPDVLILDEPTNALDNQGIEQVHRILKEEKAKGKLIIITSHHAYDIESLCDKIITIGDKGNYNYEK